MKIEISTKPNSTRVNKTGNWRTYKPAYLHEKCMACGICRQVCPEGIVFQTDKLNAGGKKYFDCDYDYCKGCGICAAECPFKAIEMELEQK